MESIGSNIRVDTGRKNPVKVRPMHVPDGSRKFRHIERFPFCTLRLYAVESQKLQTLGASQTATGAVGYFRCRAATICPDGFPGVQRYCRFVTFQDRSSGQKILPAKQRSADSQKGEKSSMAHSPDRFPNIEEFLPQRFHNNIAAIIAICKIKLTAVNFIIDNIIELNINIGENSNKYIPRAMHRGRLSVEPELANPVMA